jgi:hypothetical protein
MAKKGNPRCLQCAIDTEAPTASVEMENFISALTKAMRDAGATHYIPRAMREGSIVRLAVVLAYDGHDANAQPAEAAATLAKDLRPAAPKSPTPVPMRGLQPPNTTGLKRR